jgi:hypothetical protein
MPGIPREVIEHHLKIRPDARSVRQKLCKQSIERQNFIREEVRKLLQAGFIEQVPKANGKLRSASTTPISIRHVQKTLIHFRE